MAAIPRCAMGEEQGLRAFAHHPPEVLIIIPTLHPGGGNKKDRQIHLVCFSFFLFLSSSTAIPLKFSSLFRFFPPEEGGGCFEIGSSFVIPFVDSGRFSFLVAKACIRFDFLFPRQEAHLRLVY